MRKNDRNHLTSNKALQGKLYRAKGEWGCVSEAKLFVRSKYEVSQPVTSVMNSLVGIVCPLFLVSFIKYFNSRIWFIYFLIPRPLLMFSVLFFYVLKHIKPRRYKTHVCYSHYPQPRLGLFLLLVSPFGIQLHFLIIFDWILSLAGTSPSSVVL